MPDNKRVIRDVDEVWGERLRLGIDPEKVVVTIRGLGNRPTIRRRNAKWFFLRQSCVASNFYG